MVTRECREEGDMDEGSQKVQTPVIRQISIGDVMHNMIINTAIYYIHSP